MLKKLIILIKDFFIANTTFFLCWVLTLLVMPLVNSAFHLIDMTFSAYRSFEIFVALTSFFVAYVITQATRLLKIKYSNAYWGAATLTVYVLLINVVQNTIQYLRDIGVIYIPYVPHDPEGLPNNDINPTLFYIHFHSLTVLFLLTLTVSLYLNARRYRNFQRKQIASKANQSSTV